MKRFFSVFFIYIFFLFNIFITSATATATPNTIKKGFYTVEELNLKPNIFYTVQNNSFSDRSYILIFDAQATPLQGIRLKPQSQKYNLIPFKPQYKIVVIGDGEVTISE